MKKRRFTFRSEALFFAGSAPFFAGFAPLFTGEAPLPVYKFNTTDAQNIPFFVSNFAIPL